MELTSQDPFDIFNSWYQQVQSVEKNFNAMFVSTYSSRPSVRTVLLKQHDRRGFVFYTNIHSRKGQDLTANPYAELLFFWQDRQVRISGKVIQVSPQEADEYFAGRSRGSQIGAWASKQSQVMAVEDALENRYAMYEEQFSSIKKIPRPEFWVGFRVSPERFEFWQEQENRLHIRHHYRLDGDTWTLERLYP